MQHRKTRGSNARSAVRKAAQKAGFRSAFEQRVADGITERGGQYDYEPADELMTYKVEEVRKYLPDFRLATGIIVECKGRLTAADRKKLLLVKAQHPDKDIRLVFMYPNNKLSSKSSTRYWQWAEKHGFPWADKDVPTEWFMQ